MNPAFAIFALVGVALTATLGAAPLGFTLRSIEQSPNGDMLIKEYYHEEKDGGHVVQIWLASTEHPKDSALLFEHRRAADVIFSPDESSIAVNHHATSTDGVVEVFERASGVHYKKLISADTVRQKALSAFQHSTGERTDREFDHLYAECILWAADSSMFIVSLHGDESGVSSIQNYCCIFHIADKSISFDLASFNQHSFVQQPK